MKPLLEIIEAKYLHDYVLRIMFSTNEMVDVDLSPMIFHDKRGIFDPLKDIDFFRQFRVDYTLCWGDDIDVAPEYLYFLAHKNDVQYEALFREWGYIE
jgi:hypothetical protein